MNMNEYQELTAKTAPKNFENVGAEMANWALGLTGESGEVADHLKKAIFHGHKLDADHIAKELGDILWYAARMAATIGFTLEDVAARNIEKLKKRYPEGFSSERSINREKDA